MSRVIFSLTDAQARILRLVRDQPDVKLGASDMATAIKLQERALVAHLPYRWECTPAGAAALAMLDALAQAQEAAKRPQFVQVQA